jgi:C-terminal processing protease CtpA/Prc
LEDPECRTCDGSVFEVADAIPHSPASKVGERILKVDQTDASAFTVASLREQLEKQPGTKIYLEVQGEDGVRDVVLVLEDLL